MYEGVHRQAGYQIRYENVPLDPRTDIRDYTDGEVAWGEQGNATLQGAIAILAHAFGDDVAEAHHQSFASRCLQRMDEGNEFVLAREEVARILADG